MNYTRDRQTHKSIMRSKKNKESNSKPEYQSSFPDIPQPQVPFSFIFLSSTSTS